MSDNGTWLRREIDFLVEESSEPSGRDLTIRVVHRFRSPNVENCQPGEEIFAVILICRGKEYPLRLSLALRLLVDYLGRHRLPQSAAQIELGVRANEFYRRHAANGNRGRALTRTIARSYVKEYIRRLHRALQLAFNEVHLNLDPRKVLEEVKTVGNEIGYALRARCEWVHSDLTTTESQVVWK